MKMCILVVFFLLLLLLAFSATRTNSLTPDGLSLLAFKSAVSSDPSSALSTWSESDPDPCRWPGISCTNISGSLRVVAISVSNKNLSGYIPSELGSLIFLRRINLHSNKLSGSIPVPLFNASSIHSIFLYNNNLSGILPPELCNLPRIQNVDLSQNSLSGSLPSELRNCRTLQRLLLSQNRFSGEVPTGIWTEMRSLVQLDISSNNFSGALPPDLGYLNSLSETLNLSRNHFSGKIPSSLGNLPASVSLDLRYNNLSGEIPQLGSLANQGPTAFLNNPLLCGFPLQVQCGKSPTGSSQSPNDAGNSPGGASTTEGKKGLKPSLIILISVADAVGVAVVGLILVYIYWKLKDHDSGCSCTGTKKLGGSNGRGSKTISCMACLRTAGNTSEDNEEDLEEEGDGRLVAIDRGFKFELDELLRASAYVLGKSGMGIVYKVVLGNGVPVAVRRVGEGRGGKRYKEFASEAMAIGRVRHPNLVRLRAYYWAPDEKLLISDFVSNGNLASALRGRPGQLSLSWSIRLKIAKGTAHGLAHLHEGSPRKFTHGNVKPSNILLDNDFNPYVSDFGLLRLINIAASTEPFSSTSSSSGFFGNSLPPTKSAPLDRPNNYCAPEARIPGARPNQKWDVYSFGVVVLELLTGKSPDMLSPMVATTSASPPAEDLVKWVRRGFDESKSLLEMVDLVLHKEVHSKKDVASLFHIALACTEADPELRPRMKTICDNLERLGS